MLPARSRQQRLNTHHVFLKPKICEEGPSANGSSTAEDKAQPSEVLDRGDSNMVLVSATEVPTNASEPERKMREALDTDEWDQVALPVNLPFFGMPSRRAQVGKVSFVDLQPEPAVEKTPATKEPETDLSVENATPKSSHTAPPTPVQKMSEESARLDPWVAPFLKKRPLKKSAKGYRFLKSEPVADEPAAEAPAAEERSEGDAPAEAVYPEPEPEIVFAKDACAERACSVQVPDLPKRDEPQECQHESSPSQNDFLTMPSPQDVDTFSITAKPRKTPATRSATSMYASVSIFQYQIIDHTEIEKPSETDEKDLCISRSFHLACESRYMKCDKCRVELSAHTQKLVAGGKPGWSFT
jgi:hypothetical protein